MGEWLRDNGLGDVCAQERYRLLLILENLPAIEAWREGLDEAQRRRLNHPNAIWAHWRRATKPKQPTAPKRQHVVKGTTPHKSGRPIHWDGDAIKRAANAIRESYSTDFYVLARRALEAAVRNENDLLALLPEPAATSTPQRSIEKNTPQDAVAVHAHAA
jgi:hypothetical protein